MRYINRKDIQIIAKISGRMMQAIGIMFIVPLLVSIIYQEYFCIADFITTALISFISGSIIVHFTPKPKDVKVKHTMVIAAFTWLWACFIGTIAMYLIMDISILNLAFENMSMWTGTGLTIFTNVEVLPHSILFLRSFEGWVGGIGLVVVALSVINRSGTVAGKLYNAEGRDDKILPDTLATINVIIAIYLIITLSGIILYILAGLPVFDAVNLSFSAICTGGMSIKNANVGFYNDTWVYLITILLMIEGSISFAVYYQAYHDRGKSILKDVQFKTLIFLIFLAIVITWLFDPTITLMESLFMSVSAISSAGSTIVSTETMMNWVDTVKMVLVILMVIGGSSGSTVGGVKLIRILTVLKDVKQSVKSIVTPQRKPEPIIIANKLMGAEEVKEAASFIVLYLFILIVSWVILIFYGYGGMESLLEVASALQNCGLTAGITSPDMPLVVHITLILDMWMGRLEIIPVLVILQTMYEIIKGDKYEVDTETD